MNIRDLICLLSDGHYHSGEQLGEQLGVSRTAVWKQLKKLETLGISLEAVRGKGYCISDALELLDGAEIVAALPLAARQQLVRLFINDTLSSTNTFLLDRFSDGAGHGEVCIAEMQTNGRGRRGRNWIGAWGRTLPFSLGWRFESGASRLEGLSLAIGVVVAELLASHGVELQLKWPNDLLLVKSGQAYKLGGILIEVRGDIEGPCQVVVGIGLNVSLPEQFRLSVGQPVAAVHDVDRSISRNTLAAGLIEALVTLLPKFETEGFGPWRERWNARHYHAGQPVNVLQGRTNFEAIAEDVDEAGNLRVREEGQLRLLSGGEVSLRGR
ncbi:biotin--[acetyl-CoA-carboxylase] ligase [Phytohalomonas tamaricis]|uniref:biotin--[acetyl-CoA-carboxylase] ligase n=1 Tax=Phytohalomonas tamaricis TaxID=2081032 RepID=UPI000D0B211D|nr:biotin--[acetyl-CoA-carboxylase] ligase [Phytohalomonas tamaricis]